MKILFLVPYAPTQIRTRPSNLLRNLNKQGHHITLATMWEDESEKKALEDFRAEGIQVIAYRLTRSQKMWNILRGIFSTQPLQAWYCWQPAFAHATRRLAREEEFDVIHVEHLRSAKYGLNIRSQISTSNRKIPIVWDSVDCISLLFEQAAQKSLSPFGKWITRLELPRTKKVEAELISKFERVLVTSAADKAGFENLFQQKKFDRRSRIEVLTNGVDLTYFTPDRTQLPEQKIIFTGKLSYHANITAARFLAEDIMPIVWEKHPEIILELVGKEPHPSLYKLAVSEEHIRVIGNVPDMRPYMHKAILAVAPIVYGAGVQNKVLEAMACGTAVVATPQAVSALSHLIPGETAIVAEGAENLAKAILLLIGDGDLCKRIGDRGLAYVQRFHDWNEIAMDLGRIYRDVVQEGISQV